MICWQVYVLWEMFQWVARRWHRHGWWSFKSWPVSSNFTSLLPVLLWQFDWLDFSRLSASCIKDCIARWCLNIISNVACCFTAGFYGSCRSLLWPRQWHTVRVFIPCIVSTALDGFPPNSQHWCILGQWWKCQILGSKGQSSRSQWNKICQ